jgi:hypothetical protein
MAKVLIEDVPVKKIPEETQKKVSNVSDIDSMFEGYKETMTIDTSEQDKPVTDQPVSFGSSGRTVDPSDKSNPLLYYQRGKKQGEMKPDAKKWLEQKGDYNKATVSGELISGILFITLVDQLFPAFIAFLNNQFSKDKIKSHQMQLTAKQKSELAPVCDELIKQWEITANPLLILSVSLLGIYGMNYANLKANTG